MKKLKSLLLSVFLIVSSVLSAQTNSNCADMLPICADSTLVYPLNFAATGTVPQAQIGPNYGCLFPQPNPSWFYFEVATAGDIDMQMTCPVDIDYVMWGPFTSLASAQSQCSTMGVSPSPGVIDCNGLGGINNNMPTITNAVSGEIYIMMVSNFSNQNTSIILTQTGGLGSTDCSNIPPVCAGVPGTFSLTKNGSPTTSPISICSGESFSIFSNGDYTLSSDTISNANGGDSIYSAQLMFLLYTALPAGPDPALDPGYTGIIIPSDSITDANILSSFILDSLNTVCDTVYFVPVSGDDGIGLNGNIAGVGDNGQLNYDLDSNGCFFLGAPIQVIYNCPLILNSNFCTSNTNSVNTIVNGGAGAVNITSSGAGFLSSSNIVTPDTVSLIFLQDGDAFTVIFTDQAGCEDTTQGTFLLPQFVGVDLLLPTCSNLGIVAVEADPLSGNGGIGSITMNGIVETFTIPFDTLTGVAGTQVFIQLTDQAGCTRDTLVTIPFGDQIFIDTVTGSVSDITCHGLNDGAATIIAYSTDSGGNPNGIPMISYSWISPSGQQFGGTVFDTTFTNATPGIWTVVVSNILGCMGSMDIFFEEPDPLLDDNSVVVNPTSGLPNGSIDILVSGGTLPYASYTVVDISGNSYPTVGSMASGLPAGTYIITVEDANECLLDFPLTLTDVPLSVHEFDNDMMLTGNISNLKLYPHPATIDLNVSFDLWDAGLGTIRIFDLLGTMVMEVNQLDLVAGKNTAVIDLTELANGAYTLQLSKGENSQTQTFIKY